MDVTALVDVAIGLSLIYLATSLFVTVINEYITQTFNLRGKTLYQSIDKLIDVDSIKAILKKSPSLNPFFDSKLRKAGSYLNPNIFSQQLIGSLTTAHKAARYVISQTPWNNCPTRPCVPSFRRLCERRETRRRM